MCLEKKLDHAYHKFVMALTDLKRERSSIKGYLRTLNDSQLEKVIAFARKNSKKNLLVWALREHKTRKITVSV